MSALVSTPVHQTGTLTEHLNPHESTINSHDYQRFAIWQLWITPQNLSQISLRKETYWKAWKILQCIQLVGMVEYCLFSAVLC